MKNKNLLSLILVILIIIDIPIILYLSSFHYNVYLENFYKKEFKKYGVYETLDDYDIDNINQGLLRFLKDDKENLDNNFFNDREIEHMHDVKKVFRSIYNTFIVSIVLFLILIFIIIRLNRKDIKKTIQKIFFYSGILTFLDAFILYILVKLNFDYVFDTMHKIFFKAGTYVFNPGTERIVLLYPAALFNDMLLEIITLTLISALLLIISSILIKNYKKIFKQINIKNPKE